MNDPGCVIMASGEGKRFGGNKLMAHFRGIPLIAHVLNATEGVFAQRIVVTRHADVAALCEKRGIDVILHSEPFRSDTVRLGLTRMRHLHGCVFCQGDQPLISRDTMMALAQCAQQNPDSIWRVAYKDAVGSPVLFPARFYDELMHLPEGKGGGIVIRRHADAVRYLQVSDPLELVDIDTREDLLMLEKKTSDDVRK